VKRYTQSVPLETPNLRNFEFRTLNSTETVAVQMFEAGVTLAAQMFEAGVTLAVQMFEAGVTLAVQIFEAGVTLAVLNIMPRAYTLTSWIQLDI
jgi:hypothetical protein